MPERYMPLQKGLNILIFIPLFWACNSRQSITPSLIDTPIPNTKMVMLKLPDSLGSVEILIPNRYDTSFSWTHYSDCTGCGWRKYRFQPKLLPIFEESGWIWQDLLDSVDRFTISHSDYTDTLSWKNKLLDSTLLKRFITARHEMLLEMAKSDPKMRLVTADTVQQINGSWFSIITGLNVDASSGVISKYVMGSSTIRNNDLTLMFELRTKNNDSLARYFIENCLNLLNKIKIRNGI